MADSFETMTDAELVAALRRIDPLAPNLSDLLVEMWKRGVREAERYGRKLMAGNIDGNLNRHPDTRLYDVLEVMGGRFDGPSDAQDWITLASGYEQRIRDTLMAIGARNNPRIGYEVLELAERTGDLDSINEALRSIVGSVSANDAGLRDCLMHWAKSLQAMPSTKVAILRRLAELPWTQDLEDFFVQCDVEDDGSDASVTETINEALRRVR